MKKRFIKRFCIKCEYCICNGPNLYCGLVHAFLSDIKVCPKKMTIEEIRKSCSNFISKMDDNKTGCMGYLDSARCPICQVNEVKDLLRDTRFEFKGKFLTRSGRKRVLHK